jgi:hypothetical protein
MSKMQRLSWRLRVNEKNSMYRLASFFVLGLAVAVWTFAPKIGAAVSPGTPAADIASEHWINSQPLTIAGLRGRVVLVEFWTYG